MELNTENKILDELKDYENYMEEKLDNFYNESGENYYNDLYDEDSEAQALLRHLHFEFKNTCEVIYEILKRGE